MRTEIIVFKNASGHADLMEYTLGKSKEQLEAELTEICGANATTAEMMGKIIVEADAKGFSFLPATLERTPKKNGEYVADVAASFALLVRHVIYGTPLVLEKMTVRIKDTDRIPGATMLLAEDVGRRVKTAMGK